MRLSRLVTLWEGEACYTYGYDAAGRQLFVRVATPAEAHRTRYQKGGV